MHYYLPAHRLVGTQTEVLAQLDELILGLTGLRQLVSLHGPRPAEVPKRKLRLVERFVKRALMVLGVLLCALPARAQTSEAAAAQASTDAPALEQAQTSAPESSLPKSVKFGVTFEGYYEYDWNRPPDRGLPLRAYNTRGNSFSIQQAAIVIDAPDVEAGRRYGLRADLQYGMARPPARDGHQDRDDHRR
jgi:hypothetical protein